MTFNFEYEIEEELELRESITYNIKRKGLTIGIMMIYKEYAEIPKTAKEMIIR